MVITFQLLSLNHWEGFIYSNPFLILPPDDIIGCSHSHFPFQSHSQILKSSSQDLAKLPWTPCSQVGRHCAARRGDRAARRAAVAPAYT